MDMNLVFGLEVRVGNTASGTTFTCMHFFLPRNRPISLPKIVSIAVFTGDGREKSYFFILYFFHLKNGILIIGNFKAK